MYDSSISVILNGYRRPEKLKQQHEAIQSQTVSPSDVFLWYNEFTKYGKVAKPILNQFRYSLSSHNFGVWSRFAYALNAKTEYVCVFDDDTIPGKKWFENCLETLKTHEGLLGTVGLIYGGSPSYMDHIRYGWPNPNESVIEVDIVGHAWFFKREWLSTFWRELPPVEGHDFMGEDMHFSYALQKYLGISTYVPPHPVDNPELWGSLKGYEFGVDKVAISTDGNITKWDLPFNRLRQKGWKLIAERSRQLQTHSSFPQYPQKLSPEDRQLQSQNILLLTNLYPPQELGGYGRSLADFAAGLQARGHKIHVLTSDAPYLGCTPDREDGIDRRLQLWGTYEGQTQEFQDPNQINAIVAHNDRILREVLAQVQPDLCLVGNISFLGPAIFGPLLEQQIPTIHHLGFAQVPYPPTLAPQHPLYHLATASEAVAQAVRDSGLTQLATSTIYPGALVRQFSRPTLPQRDKLRILYAGLVIQSKGPHTLLEALTVLQQQQMDFECTIAGNAIHADYLAALQQYLQQTGLVHRVRLVGHLDRSQLADCFAQHNVFVFPSIQPEAFGIVQVEAMAAGLTVLSTGVGGASEVIESGVSGLLFPAGDPIALAQALISLPQDPERWARLAATGQAAAFAKFDIERSIDQLELKFEELLRRKAELSSPMALSIPTSPATDPYTQWLCDRITNVVRVYGLDPNDQSTINLLRELRRQTAELWKAAPAEQLPDLYQGSVGQAYRALLHSGFQSQPLTGEEANYLQALTNQVSQHTVQHPVGLQAFLGVMLYLPAGKMKVDQAPVKLPAWLLSDYQSVFEPPGTVEPTSAPQPIAPPTSATVPLHQDMTFLNRLLGCANLYYIDPEETSIAEELRLIRQQVGQIWAQTPLEQLESLYKSEFGRRYLALLDSGYQNYPLLPEEESVVQELTGLISQGIDRYPGLNALLAIMMYLPPGKMQVRDAANRLPAWLLPDYQRIFEADQATAAPLVPSPQPTVPTAAPTAAAPPAVSQPPNLAEDMVFLNRFLGCSNLYEIDPEDGETVAELRQLRQRVAEFWLTVPPSQLEAVFNSELGRRYGMYLKSGFQREPLTDGERELLVKLAETAARGFEQPGGLNAFLGAMMYYAPGQMQVKDAATRLPGWLFPLYAAVFESEAQKKMTS